MTTSEPSPGERSEAASSSTDSGWSDRTEVLEHIALGLRNQPVGVIALDVEPGPVATEIAPTVEAIVGEPDAVLQLGPHRLVVIKPGLIAPAEAEGLTLRLRQEIVDQPVGSDTDERRRATIGVAVSHAEDGPADLLRYAEHAIGDARMLGGDRVVFFDDPDRELLVRPDEP